MRERATLVLDVGKTLSKLSLWGTGGELLEQRSRPNEPIETGQYLGLDAQGIERWLALALSDLARVARVGAIIPVAHGAAAAAISRDGLVQTPLDYEHPIPGELRQTYDAQREAFALTGSPRLPQGLNLGAQLHYLEALQGGPVIDGQIILPWPQYWSWVLCGTASSDVTSLGCHTDLWYPLAGVHSRLSVERGWAARLAPLASPGTMLGVLTPRWAQRTGLASDVEVYCGLHDSNAALLAARAFAEIEGRDATVLSTGTWFVAMRTPGSAASFDIASLSERRDCLVNVDALGKPVPSARFMGGREIELLCGTQLAGRKMSARVDAPDLQPALLHAVAAVLARGSMILPSFAPGSGPYPQASGRWISAPEDEAQRLATICLYAALVADVSLDLIGARDRLLIEGRFSRCNVLTRALAALRPRATVYVPDSDSEVALGALRLLHPELGPPSRLATVPPLLEDLQPYRERWRQEAACVA
jgi:sugar (pentulose or hexulose) kinase